MKLVEVFVEQIHAVHAEIRDEIRALPDDAVTWTPSEGANSIAVLVTHLVGSELETVRLVAAATTARDRAAEFQVTGLGANELVRLLDEADAVVDELGPRIGETDLQALRVRPSALDQAPKSGEFRLVSTLGHAREHLGQILLTKQLHENGAGRQA
jgi:hypothetical protein